MEKTGRMHVVVGIIASQRDEICIATREKDEHFQGMWEFPGGKVESGEGAIDALKRELNEELGITVEQAKP